MCFLVSINLVPRWGYRMTLRVRPRVNIFEGVKQHMPITQKFCLTFSFVADISTSENSCSGYFTLNGYLVIVVCYNCS